jgi:hypothetical protein
VTSAGAARHLRARSEVLDGADEVEAEYAEDTRDAARLGVPARRGRNLARSGVIAQPWLREAIERWSRFRLSAGYSFTTIDSGAQSLRSLSLFLAERPEICGVEDLTREVLEDFLVWIAAKPQWSTNTRHHTLTFVKVLLDWGHGRMAPFPAWRPAPWSTRRKVSLPPDQLPRFIPEFVMNQLESEANLARLRNPTVRRLVVLLMETGLRGGHACGLASPNEPWQDWPNMDFEQRQQLLRLVLVDVRVDAWQVELRLRIPLDQDPTRRSLHLGRKRRQPPATPITTRHQDSQGRSVK